MRRVKKQSFRSHIKRKVSLRLRTNRAKRRRITAFLNSKDNTKKLYKNVLKGGTFVKMKLRFKSDLVRKIKY